MHLLPAPHLPSTLPSFGVSSPHRPAKRRRSAPATPPFSATALVACFVLTQITGGNSIVVLPQDTWDGFVDQLNIMRCFHGAERLRWNEALSQQVATQASAITSGEFYETDVANVGFDRPMQGHEVCTEVLDTESGTLHIDGAALELAAFVAYVEGSGNNGMDWSVTQPHDGLTGTDLHAVTLFARLAWTTSDTIGCQTRMDNAETAWLLVCWVCGGGADDMTLWPAHVFPSIGTNACYYNTPTQTLASQTLPVEADTAQPSTQANTSVPDTSAPAEPTVAPPTDAPATAAPATKSHPTSTPLPPAATPSPPYTPPEVAPVRVQTAFWTTIGMKISSAWPSNTDEQTAWVARFVRTLKDSWSSGVGYPLGLEVTLICPLMQGSEKPVGDLARRYCRFLDPNSSKVPSRSSDVLQTPAGSGSGGAAAGQPTGIYAEVLVREYLGDKVEADVNYLKRVVAAAADKKPPLYNPALAASKTKMSILPIPFGNGKTVMPTGQGGKPGTSWDGQAAESWGLPEPKSVVAWWLWTVVSLAAAVALAGIVALGLAIKKPREAPLGAMTVTDFYRAIPPAGCSQQLLPEEHFCTDDVGDVASSCEMASHTSQSDLGGLGYVMPMGRI